MGNYYDKKFLNIQFSTLQLEHTRKPLYVNQKLTFEGFIVHLALLIKSHYSAIENNYYHF